MSRARHSARSAERHHRRQRQWAISQARSQPYSGAIKLTNTDRQLDFHRWGKIAAACMFLTSGVLWLIPGSSETNNNATVATKPEHKIMLASFATPRPPEFVFDDNKNALAEKLGFDDNNEFESTFNQDISHPISNNKSIQTIFEPAEHLPALTIDVETDPITQEQPSEATPLNNLNAKAIEDSAPIANDELVSTITVQEGDSTWDILVKQGIATEDMAKLMSNEIVKQHLSSVKIGQQFEITKSASGQFVNLVTKPDNANRIFVSKSGEDFTVEAINLPIEKERVVTAGTIEQSLYLAAQQANLSQSTIMELSSIFQWELDFARDIRKGDQFSLVYDKLYRDGKYIGDGDILAAEFIRGGKTYRAIRFTTDDEKTSYYTPEGQSLRRTFMRHPVDVVRITSHFDPNRMHPVLHKIRAHRGVDYGSPHGSPIYATADGKVTFSGTKGAYGKTVILQHGQKFSTLYAHMSKISDKSKMGKSVKQGDVIGYVGATGRVTGTHLHYEFRVNNKHVDPLKVELPVAKPLPKRYLSELRLISDSMSRQMTASLAAEKSLVSR